MNILPVHIILTAIFIAIASALPGVFLVLHGLALMSDAISHAILPGIVVMFLIVKKLESPWLIFGASCAGMLTVLFTQAIINSGKLKKDAAIGLVFPLFFSIGVILISKYARNIHLDSDMVLLGELAFIPFTRLNICGYDCGPYALWTTGFIALLNCLLTFLFFKELKLAIFDQQLSTILHFKPHLLYYGLMFVTCITTVTSFDSVGSIVIVALMITPAASAYLISRTLSSMVINSLYLGVLSSIFGYFGAFLFDVSIAGSIATANGILFLFIFLFSPYKGVVACLLMQRKQNETIAVTLLCTLLKETPYIRSTDQIRKELGWSTFFNKKIIMKAKRLNLIHQKNNIITLIK